VHGALGALLLGDLDRQGEEAGHRAAAGELRDQGVAGDDLAAVRAAEGVLERLQLAAQRAGEARLEVGPQRAGP
jgi:hypothetical protein